MMEKKLRVAGSELTSTSSVESRANAKSPRAKTAFAFTRNSQLATRNQKRASGPTASSRRGVPPAAFRAAFTFIEVLFAVILLGIGFIMIAAVFPVAVQQTAAVSSETQGTLIANDAIRKIQAVADAEVTGQNSTNTLFPVTGTTAAPQIYAITTSPPNSASANFLVTPPPAPPVCNGLMAALGSDAFYSADKRYGWVGFYRRDSATAGGAPIGPFAQAYVIALQNPNFANYLYPVPAAGQTVISSPVPPPIPPVLYGFTAQSAAQIPASFFYNADGTTTIVLSFNSAAASPQSPSTNGATGAFVLVGTSTGATPAPASMIGRFFRLGNTTTLPASMVAAGNTVYQAFEAQSGSDITGADVTANAWTVGTGNPVFTANVFCIGRAPSFNSATNDYSGPFTGPNQDIGAATAFIRVNTANN
jgi:type II secretory pathway pseudopilin PulG